MRLFHAALIASSAAAPRLLFWRLQKDGHDRFMMGHHPIMTRGMMEGSKGMMSNQMSSYPPLMKQKQGAYGLT